MKSMAIALVLLGLTWPVLAGAAGVAHVTLPADLSGKLNGADYIIRAPMNWNGTLLVFAHGNQRQPGTAEIAPTAWPPADPSVEEQLLGLGFALAGSGYTNSPKEGVQRTLALTNFFKGKVGNPNRTIVWGNSLGGLVALKLVEEHPGIYDGCIAVAATSAGRAENMDSALAFGLAYKAVFGWPEAAWGPVEDVRDDLDFEADVRGVVPWPPSNYGRWEFIRLIMRLTTPAFWGKDPQTNSFFFGLGVWKATAQRAAAEAEAGGPVADNVGFEYTLTPNEKALSVEFVRPGCRRIACRNEHSDKYHGPALGEEPCRALGWTDRTIEPARPDDALHLRWTRGRLQ